MLSEQNWKRKEYESWNEAFRGLVPKVRQQSVRVAEYTHVLFVQACASSYGKNNPEWEERMQGQYADLAYKCGLYHQLGKAMLMPELQLWHKEFSEEEAAIYQTYPTEGLFLVEQLQEQKDKEKSRGRKFIGMVRRQTENIPWLMVRESCEQHMERWDGKGYPAGLIGEEISPIAQIVGLAKELDRLVSETKSEDPFSEAYVILTDQAGKQFSEELIEILKASRGKCRAIYRKYIQYSKTIPKTIPLVERRKERPMGLVYRELSGDVYEAVPWFGGVLDEPEKRESLEKLEPMMVRTKILDEVMFYFLYEAADTVLHMQNWEFRYGGILVPMLAGFYKGDSKMERLNQLYADQPIDMSKLLLTVPESAVLEAEKHEIESITEYIEAGVELVLDQYHPEKLSLERIKEIGFDKVRVAPEVNYGLRMETQRLFQASGITCYGHGEKGTEVVEEELIQKLIAGERA